MQQTENGALSNSTTGDARLDLFSKVTRNTPENLLDMLLEKSWEQNKLDTLKIVFNLRDCREGKGEREQFRRAIMWLIKNHQLDLEANIINIPFYGRFKDLLFLLGTPLEEKMLRFYVRQLEDDKALVGTEKSKEISLAAKYAPNEGGEHDKKYGAASKFARALGGNKKTYRKEWLGVLRREIDKNSILVEMRMTNTAEDWDKINFSKIPSLALKKYKKAWNRHQKERYEGWLESVKKGESKINVMRLMPHEIAEPYICINLCRLNLLPTPDETVEVQWKAFVDQTRKTSKFKNALSVVDVSGSMLSGGNPAPLLVAISLGLLTAELTEGPFHNKFFTFSSTPKLEEVKGDSLLERVKNISNAHWEMSTNIQAVFEVLLSSAKMFECPEEKMPKTIFVFSDMQFDQAGRNMTTNWEQIKEQYREAGYALPRLVFWNLSGKTFDFPVTANESNVSLISGFSADLLKMIIEGEDLSPVELMLKTIRGPRYDRVKEVKMFHTMSTRK